MEELGLRWLLGQGVSLIALTLCLVAFASKRDDKLFVLLLFANVAFAAQFALFESWVAAGISALIVLRIALVRRYPRNRILMATMLLATLAVAALSWSGPQDIPALTAGLLGTWACSCCAGFPCA